MLAAATHGRSPLPLIARLETERLAAGLGPPSGHSQRYPRRRLEEPLTLENTQPIRFKLDFSSLFEETAVEYTVCFKEGAWYRRGIPESQTPPADGVPTCIRNANEWAQAADTGCWGKCLETDVLTASARDKIIGATTAVALEMQGFLSVTPVEGALTFEVSKGAYFRGLEQKGWPVTASCAADCTNVASVAVGASYCEEGVPADAVLSVVKPPPISGVAGTGSSCASDQNKRPTWLVFEWIEQVGEAESEAQLLSRVRALIRHELLHALGFSLRSFLQAKSSSGSQKQLLQRRAVRDVDGATDTVWFFNPSSRAASTAATFFGCDETSAEWEGLPLMGLPEMGRASHWETRIMRDDVMSYGFQATVSAVTLAAMEDLGLYVANYSAAGCMLWGRMQGCAYVRTRCGNATDDSSAATASPSDCEGDPFWNTPDAYLAQKCAKGTRPCDTLVNAGFENAGGARACNAQCHTPVEGRADCGAGPAAAVEAATEPEPSYVEENWQSFLWLGVWAAGVFFFASFLRAFACPPKGSVCVTASLSALLGALGAAALGGAVFFFFFAFELFSSFAGKPSLYILAGIGAVLLALMLLTSLALCCRSRCVLLLVLLTYVCFLLVEAAAVVLALYWGYLVTSVTNDTVDTLHGSGGEGKWDGQFGEAALGELEGMMCRTYQLCCSDLAPDGGGSCLSLHQGQTVDVAVAMTDPGSDKFCPYVSGSSQTVKPAEGTCELLEWAIPDLELQSCRANLCTLGIDGYEEFVRQLVNWMKDNAVIFGAVGAFAVLFQLVLVVNLWKLRKEWKSSAGRVGPDSPAQMATTTVRVKSLRRNWTRSSRSMPQQRDPAQGYTAA